MFLNHELRDRFSRDHLNDRVLDALIYWSLRDTDPDNDRVRPRPDIATAIEDAFPPAKSVLIPRMNARLAELSKKDSAGMERLRHYRATDSFCLPFEMRQTLAIEASSAVARQQAFRASIEVRLLSSRSSRLRWRLAAGRQLLARIGINILKLASGDIPDQLRKGDRVAGTFWSSGHVLV